MKLIVGLGNWTHEYDLTRHNIGFMFLDYFKYEFSINEKLRSMECITYIKTEKVIFIKPMTFMNNSGDAVLMYVNYYNVSLDDVLIIQDDLDMLLGRFKLIFNHGDGGHNGIKDISCKLGSREYLRLKIGIGNNRQIDTKDYVLGKFSCDDLAVLNRCFSILGGIIEDFIILDRNSLMQKYNSLKGEEWLL